MINFKEIEAKWQERWEKDGIYKFDSNSKKEKIYCLEMFSYPSGAKLHMGHWYNYGPVDTWARFKRMEGFNVFHPMGFDAFGLPAENYAIKTGVHPAISTDKNIETMENQLRRIGGSWDWDYEVKTCKEDYYKWTQWLFLKFYEKGLAYKKEAPVNFCPKCQTVLANEQVISGECERCGTVVVRKNMSQWFFKITDYAEELLNDIDKLDWPERTKVLQRNWIGKSNGAYVDFKVDGTDKTFRVFTTRCDTLFGATYCVLAPEHELVDLITTEEQKEAVEEYKVFASKQSEIERTSTTKEKTGVATGAYAINPVNGKKIPIWISDYVLSTYGTGAIMAVPAHDERDYEFAKKFGIEIIPVLEGGDVSKAAYTEDGLHINSDFLNGLNKEEAINKMFEYLKENDIGEKTTNYRLRDWLVSRQRYWGAPIPVIYCDDCGIVPVPEEDLPVKLPMDVEFTPDGESPLKKCESFMKCKCPKCGKDAHREADTLDTFVCSSWYFLRYPNAKDHTEAFNKDVVNKMLPVDKYVGGIEHACMHLLYARFFTKALRDMGYLDFDEPFTSLVHQGLILGPDGEKMSKSKGNTVAPDPLVDEYGSDVLRGYLMFGFNYVDGGPWTDDGIVSINKFYHKIERLAERVTDSEERIPEIDRVLHNSIKSIRTDIEKFQFNTSMSKIMEYSNILVKYETSGIPKYYIEQLLLILAPFAPHITEELWERIGNSYSIHNESYPMYDEKYLIEEEKEIAVQVNGKLRGTVMININDSEDVMKEKAIECENVKRHIEGKEIVKVIIIKGKIVNIVVK